MSEKYREIILYYTVGFMVMRFSAHDCTLAEAQELAKVMGYTVPKWYQWWRWNDIIIYHK